VHAVIELQPPAKASDQLARELIDFCRTQISHVKCPRSVDFADSLPRSAAGKMQRRLVRDPYWAGRDRKI
jgi:acyl-coenzyme A synthetase/AMP-(fatty) acid ligase